MNLPLSELLDLALKGTLVLGAATLLSLALRKASAALRHLVWFVAVLGILALPLASARLNSLEVSWFPDWGEESTAVATASGNLAPAPIALLPPTVTKLPTPAAAPLPLPSIEPAPIESPAANWPAFIWVSGSLLCTLPYLFGLLRLWRTTRLAAPLDPELHSDLKHAVERLALSRRVEVKIGADVRMPMTWGALFPVVLLPPEFADWTERRRRIVLLHELAHVKRFDWLTQLLAGVAAAIYWFNPLAWFAARRMRVEREQACDDLVLRSGSKASDYADELLQIANAFGSRRWNNRAAIPMARRSSLEERLRSILTDGRERRTLTRWIIAMAFVVMTGIVVPVAMLQAAEKAEKSDAKAEPNEPEADDEYVELVRRAIQLGYKDAKINRKNGRIVFKTSDWTVEADSAKFNEKAGELQFQGEIVLTHNGVKLASGGFLNLGPDGMADDIAWGGTPEEKAAKAKPANEDVRSFVRLVMGSDDYTFEGKPIAESAIRKRLSAVSNRQSTVLELAVTSDKLSWGKVTGFKSQYAQLANELGFEYSSFIGIHEASTKGSPPQPREKQGSPAGAPPGPRPANPRFMSPPEATKTQLQKRLLEIAKNRLDQTRMRLTAGAGTQEELEEANFAYEVAKDPNNKLRHAELRVQLLDNRLRRIQGRRGVVSASKVQQAEIEKLQAELEFLQLKDEAARMSDSRPDPNTSTEYWNSQAVRYQDSVLNELLISYNLQIAELAKLRGKYLDRHPIIIQSNQQLAQIAKQIRERIQLLGAAAVAAVPKRPLQKPRTKAERTALLNQLKKLWGKERWNVLAAVHDDPLLLSLIAKRNAHQQTMQSLRKSLGEKHPTLLKEQESLNFVSEQLEERADAVLKGMEIEIAAMSEAQPRRFTVLGRVVNAGVMEMPTGVRQIPLLDAIAQAGGFTRYANTTAIKVRRRENGSEKVFSVNAKKLSETPEEQFLVLPDDQITVMERIF